MVLTECEHTCDLHHRWAFGLLLSEPFDPVTVATDLEKRIAEPRTECCDTESFSDDADDDEVAVQITDQGGRALTLPKEERKVMTDILN